MGCMHVDAAVTAQEWPFLVTADEFGPFFRAMGTRRPALVLGHMLQ